MEGGREKGREREEGREGRREEGVEGGGDEVSCSATAPLGTSERG